MPVGRVVSPPWRLKALLGGLSLWVFAVGGPEAQATLPLPTYPNCGNNESVAECPPDIVDSTGALSGDSWALINYVPDPLKKRIRKAEHAIGTGSSTTLAWQKTTGRFDVTIAILDCGIRWREGALRNKVAINKGEIPAPIGSDGKVCTNYDCDKNGLFNVKDYQWDTRVVKTDGRDEADGDLDVSDLIYAFSDGQDDDGDGYVDNIGGWDFLWNDNDPYTTNDFYHMSSVLEEAAGEGGEADSAIGHCPNCSVMPVRISDSFVGEGDKISEGIIYAVDHGASVIGMALGSMTNPEALQYAMQYAWDNNVTIVAAAGDELGYHHNYPGANDHAIYVHSIKFYPTISLETATTTLGFFGCNNFGARMDAVAASNSCATGSVAATSGMAGLVISRARDLGITLSAAEVRQLILRTTDDIDVPESRQKNTGYFPSYPGWDQFFGYGRVNSGRAVSKVAAATIPPEVIISSPSWFQYVDPRVVSNLAITGTVAAKRASSYSYTVHWAPGADPRDADYVQIASKTGLTTATNGTLATFDVGNIDLSKLDPTAPSEALNSTMSIEEKQKKINARAVTLRIRATDNLGNVAEERKHFFLIEDPDLMPGFPIKLGYSSEASPILYDLDDDGRKEIVLSTSNGIIHAFRSNGTELSGFPVRTAVLPSLDANNLNNHLEADAYASGEMSDDVRQGVVGTAAVGDLEGDGIPEIVVGTLQGYVFAWDALGRLKPGFPVARDPANDADTSPKIWRDPGMFSATVLYDLDNDGKLEIIQGSMDQKMYVWRSNGARQAGFPVLLANPDGSTGVTTVAGRIVSSPAVGDLDGDGDNEIVVGSNEYMDDKSYVGFAYAIQGTGNNHPTGPIVPGWPVSLVGILSGVINYIGEGVTVSPSIADLDRDGEMEIVLSGVGSQPVILHPDGSELLKLGTRQPEFGSKTNTTDNVFWGVVNNAAFADFDGGGDIEVMMGGSGMSFFIALGLSRYANWDHLATVWKARTGKMLDAFPRVTEDISFFNSPSVGDLSGDGLPEMVIGTSGYILHAFKVDGSQPAGWPKFTGGWLIASPAIGDIDGDSKNEVVVVTREGYLFAWNTQGAGGNEWPLFRHDPQNSGNYNNVAEYASRMTGTYARELALAAAPATVSASAAKSVSTDAGGCSSLGGSASASWGGLMALAGVLLALARRRS